MIIKTSPKPPTLTETVATIPTGTVFQFKRHIREEDMHETEVRISTYMKTREGVLNLESGESTPTKFFEDKPVKIFDAELTITPKH